MHAVVARGVLGVAQGFWDRRGLCIGLAGSVAVVLLVYLCFRVVRFFSDERRGSVWCVRRRCVSWGFWGRVLFLFGECLEFVGHGVIGAVASERVGRCCEVRAKKLQGWRLSRCRGCMARTRASLRVSAIRRRRWSGIGFRKLRALSRLVAA